MCSRGGLVVWFVGALTFAACASGDPSGDDDCDPTAEDCGGGADAATAADAAIDAAPLPDAVPVPDAVPKKGFGEPCLDKAECASNICILAGIEGICTETCVAGSCPDDYGCIGVFGAIEPDEVADVCVPSSTQLCTSCSLHTECSLFGSDLCLTYDDGKQFCSQDCETIGCPTGYTCTTVNVGGTDYQQCLPDSGACDCNDALMGATEACNIDTPFGTCAGERTCTGATGWGDCEPPSSTDTPDATFTDDDCDGIDGDIDGGIFVAAGAGVDTGSCGLVYSDPCNTINHGLDRAVSAGRSYVYVRAGTYSEIVELHSGIHIYGGYDVNWQRDSHTEAGHGAVIVGGLHGVEGEYMAILAHDLPATTIVADLFVNGPDAVGAVGTSARSSYGIHAKNAADLVVERVTITAGDGAIGVDGDPGGDAPFGVSFTPNMRGGDGGDAQHFFALCDNSTRGAAGSAGTNACPGGSLASGGAGGQGGTMDTTCIGGFCFDDTMCDATDGASGTSAATFVVGGIGYRGAGGVGDCAAATSANSGTVSNGAAGVGASSSGGLLVGAYWYAVGGSSGGAGDNGTGGGGGGGSSGCDEDILPDDTSGAGGGGGGAGGCAAQSGGGGGYGGGGSFGLFAVSSTVTAANCVVQRGNGGDGGDGGVGGRGQSGGPRGFGGEAAGTTGPGGDGGDGAHGGHGGGGGGGAGGISYGIYSYGSTVSHTCTFTGGSSGAGGAAGQSAPTAPPAERDGNDGTVGATPPAAGGVGTCAAPGSC